MVLVYSQNCAVENIFITQKRNLVPISSHSLLALLPGLQFHFCMWHEIISNSILACTYQVVLGAMSFCLLIYIVKLYSFTKYILDTYMCKTLTWSMIILFYGPYEKRKEKTWELMKENFTTVSLTSFLGQHLPWISLNSPVRSFSLWWLILTTVIMIIWSGSEP